jgi:hypothetical protein
MKLARLAATVLLLASLLLVLGHARWLGRQPSAGRPGAERPQGAPAPSTAVPQPAFTESRQCRECHRAIYDEWLADQHATAYAEDKYVLFTQDYSRVECLSCHAPKPMLEVGIENEPQVRPAQRQTGVDCLACHLLSGSARGWRGDTGAACAGPAVPDMKTSQACFHCHSAHNLFQEYLASPQCRQGQRCQDCHMAEVRRPVAEGGPARATRRHLFHAGGHDPEALKRVLRLDMGLEKGILKVTLTNADSAHGVPGEISNRLVRLEVSVLVKSTGPNPVPGGWEEVLARQYFFRAPPRFARDKVPSTQVMPGEPRVMVIEVPPEAVHGRIKALLQYKLEKDLPGCEFMTMLEKELDF